MKHLLLGISALFILTSCGAQSSSISKNADGSMTLFNNGTASQTVVVTKNGNLGIGQSNPTDKLEVNGQIHAKSVKVDLKDWADYVFEEGYELLRLREIETYVNTHGHLPNIPSTAEVLEQGIDLGDMNRLLLEKVEELTLHLIQKEKEIGALKAQQDQLAHRLKHIEKQMNTTPKQ